MSGIKKVDLYLNGALYKTNSNSSTSFTIDSMPAGQNTLRAVVTHSGGTTTSRDFKLFAKESGQLLSNKNFQYGTAYWYPSRRGNPPWESGGYKYEPLNSNVSISAVASGGHNGTGYIRVSGRNSVSDGIYQSISGQLHDWKTVANPSGNYKITFTAWVKNESVTSNMRISVKRFSWANIYPNKEPESRNSSYVSVGTGGWTQLTYTWSGYSSSGISSSSPTDLCFMFENSDPNAVYLISDCSVTISK